MEFTGRGSVVERRAESTEPGSRSRRDSTPDVAAMSTTPPLTARNWRRCSAGPAGSGSRAVAARRHSHDERRDPGGDRDHGAEHRGRCRAQRVRGECPAAEASEGDEPDRRDRPPPPGGEADDGAEGERGDDDADDQRRLVVGAEDLDSEVLQRGGVAVDELGADGAHRRRPRPGEHGRRQLAGAEGDTGAGDSCDGGPRPGHGITVRSHTSTLPSRCDDPRTRFSTFAKRPAPPLGAQCAVVRCDRCPRRCVRPRCSSSTTSRWCERSCRALPAPRRPRRPRAR